ncbi:MAG: hypothetical protein NC121_20385, partial [Blautia sp.]|nr:hypothetical protein [Blautia sp.]
EAFSGFGEIAGYPNAEGRTWYEVLVNQIYGINSASGCKEGAWAFLKFLLGEEYQAQTRFFPAIQDALETKLAEAEELSADSYHYINPYTNESHKGYPPITEEDKEFIRNMTKNGGREDSMKSRTVLAIIQEEAEYYFQGDKSVEEVARIIQNRIELYLNE